MEIRTEFHHRLEQIQDDILVMGGLVAEAIGRSVASLKEGDVEMAERVILGDDEINRRRFRIEEDCIEIIATQQPLACDLRTIICALSIIPELERIGDYAVGTARIVTMNGDGSPLAPPDDMLRTSEKAIDMLRRSLIAFVEGDCDAARQIAADDDEVDRLHDDVVRELLTDMINDPTTIARATHLMWAAHNLERSADRVTNICERVIYLSTGTMEEIRGSRC